MTKEDEEFLEAEIQAELLQDVIAKNLPAIIEALSYHFTAPVGHSHQPGTPGGRALRIFVAASLAISVGSITWALVSIYA